jgi:hypothetical protein
MKARNPETQRNVRCLSGGIPIFAFYRIKQ